MTQTVRTVSALALLGLCAGAAMALPYDPTTFAGTYATTKSTTVVRGTAGPINNVVVYAPWLLNSTDGQQDSSVAGVDAQGNPVGAVTTFTSGNPPPLNTVRVVAALGSTRAAWPAAGGSNNRFIDEGANNRSDALGTLLADGTAVWRANFAGVDQNNLEYQALPINVNTNPVPSSGAFKVFQEGLPGITGDPAGFTDVFLGVPGADRFGPNNDLYTAVTMFDANNGHCPSGTGVYRNNDNNPNAPFCVWRQVNTPIPTNALTSETRQTQPHIKKVNLGAGCSDALYTVFGVGITPGTGSTTPYSGGSARPLFLFVAPTQNVANGYTLPYRVIRADGNGSDPTVPADANFRFISAQATGGGAGPFTGGMFDMNSKGQVVAVRENRSGSVFVFEVLRYDPIVSNCQITGYNPPVVIARNGQDGIVAQLLNTTYVSGPPAAVITSSLVPFSGVSIDDNGNIAFVGTTESFTEVRTVSGTGATGSGPVLYASTNTLFYYEAARNSLHAIVKGGQNGDILSNINAGGPNLGIGFFPVDAATDSFTRAGMNKAGNALSLCFRSNNYANGVYLGSGTTVPAGFTPRGGLLNQGSGQESSVRGVIQIKFPGRAPCPGDINGDGVVNFSDLNLVLAGFGTTYTFTNLNQVLAAFGQNCP